MPTATLEALDELIEQVQARIPASPNSPRNVKLRKGLEQKLAEYFRQLSDAFPYHKIAKLYNAYVTESLGSETEGLLDPMLGAFDETLTTTLNGQAVEAYLSGSAEMVTWGKTVGGKPIAFEGPPIEQAIRYAKNHLSKAKVIDGINKETVKRISQIISDGIKNKRGIPGITSDIRHGFDWMARGAPSEIKGLTLKSRADMIARTETAEALSNAALDRGKDMGITSKEWITVGDSDVSDDCLGNEAERAIPMNQMFSGGVMAPPQHPRCRCALAPSMGK